MTRRDSRVNPEAQGVDELSVTDGRNSGRSAPLPPVRAPPEVSERSGLNTIRIP